MEAIAFRRLTTVLVSTCFIASTLLTTGAGASARPTHIGSIVSGGLQTVYPVTITDCGGRKVTYQAPPSRVVTLDDNITETLLALGLYKKIVGITKFDTPSGEWKTTKAQMDTLPVINKSGLTNAAGYPSKETVLAKAPDFIASVYDSAFSQAYGPATKAFWTSVGIKSYQTLQDCVQGKPQYNFNLLYSDIHNLGVIFNVQGKAASLISSLKGKIAALQAQVKKSGVKSYTIGTADGETSIPGTLGVTTANAIIAQAGSKYAFIKEDASTNVVGVNWEVWVKKNPHVIWLITDLGKTAAQIKHFLLTNPKTKNVDGVKHQRFVVVSYNDAIGSPRCVDGLREMVTGLLALKKSGRL